MTEAVFGLVGVLIGGALSGGIQWLMARRTERAAARTAARLVALELDAARDLLRQWLVLKRWMWEWWKPMSAWPDHRSTLAQTLSSRDWALVRLAYERLTHIDDAVEDLRHMDPELEAKKNAPWDAGDDSAIALEATVRLLSNALHALAPAAGTRIQEVSESDWSIVSDARAWLGAHCAQLRRLGLHAELADEVEGQAQRLIAVALKDPDALWGSGPDRTTMREVLLHAAGTVETCGMPDLAEQLSEASQRPI
jgi:hypothetical protein